MNILGKMYSDLLLWYSCKMLRNIQNMGTRWWIVHLNPCLLIFLIYFPAFLSLFLSAVVTAGSYMMPGPIPDPRMTAGSLPSLGPLAGIPYTTLTDQLKYANLRELGAMLSPLHFLGKLGKRPLTIKTEVRMKVLLWFLKMLWEFEIQISFR